VPERRGVARSFVLAAVLLLAAPAMGSARTYWVSPVGIAGRTGADSLADATTLGWFNANAEAGDVCRFRSGRYADPVQPEHDGTRAARIRYYGFPRDPGAVTVANIRFGYQRGSFCTARWLHTEHGIAGCDGVSGVYVRGDSIASCWTEHGDDGLLVRGKDCVFDSLRIKGSITGTGQTHWIDLFVGGNPPAWFSASNVISHCRFDAYVLTSGPQGDVHVLGMGHGIENVIRNNRFEIEIEHCQGYFFAVELYEGYRNVFDRNTWNVHVRGPILGSRGVWCHRDSSSENRWTNNDVTVEGRGGDLSFMLTNPGSFASTTGHNTFANNRIRDDLPQPNTGVFWFYDGTRGDTIEGNTIVTRAMNPALLVEHKHEVDASVFRGNTYRTGGLVAFDCTRTVVVNSPQLIDETYESMLGSHMRGVALRVPPGFVIPPPGTRNQPRKSVARKR
jgi:hypothetical protein